MTSVHYLRPNERHPFQVSRHGNLLNFDSRVRRVTEATRIAPWLYGLELTSVFYNFSDLSFNSFSHSVNMPLTLSSNPSLLAGVVAVLCALSIVYSRISLYLSRRKFKQENGCEPLLRRFPIKDPIFGIDNMVESIRAKKELRLLDRFYVNFIKYGNTFGSKIAQRNIVATIEPQNVKTILSLKFKDYSLGNREDTLGPLLGKGIFTMDGDFWAHSRAMIRPNFTRDQVADLNAFERHIQDLWKLIPRDGSTVDLQELFFRFTIDSATEFLFGVSTNTLKESSGGVSGAEFARAFTIAQDSCASRTRLGMLKFFFKDKEGERATQFCHDFVGQFVDEAVRYRGTLDIEKNGEEKYVFLHELAKDTVDKARLQDELLNVLLAGRDTTASLLSNMWFMLAKNPAIFAKLRQEVEETFPDGELPTYEKLRNMKYLKYCMNECRCPLHPPTIHKMLTCYSSPYPPRCPGELPSGNPRHCSPSRRRTIRQIAHFHPERQRRVVLNVRHAPTQGLLW
jgi:cytochrome P450